MSRAISLIPIAIGLPVIVLCLNLPLSCGPAVRPLPHAEQRRRCDEEASRLHSLRGEDGWYLRASSPLPSGLKVEYRCGNLDDGTEYEEVIVSDPNCQVSYRRTLIHRVTRQLGGAGVSK